MNELVQSLVGDGNEVRPYTRDQILQLEEAMKQMPQVDLAAGTSHHFAPGVYVRELFIPAGTVLTGKIHRYETMNIVISGSIKVTTDNGIETITGPAIFNSKPGTKKAGFALTNVIFLNVHPTDLTDVDEIEEEFIAPSFEALEFDEEHKL